MAVPPDIPIAIACVYYWYIVYSDTLADVRSRIRYTVHSRSMCESVKAVCKRLSIRHFYIYTITKSIVTRFLQSGLTCLSARCGLTYCISDSIQLYVAVCSSRQLCAWCRFTAVRWQGTLRHAPRCTQLNTAFKCSPMLFMLSRRVPPFDGLLLVQLYTPEYAVSMCAAGVVHMTAHVAGAYRHGEAGPWRAHPRIRIPEGSPLLPR